MDDITASIIVACQTAGAVTSINKLGFALAMVTRELFNFAGESIKVFSDMQEETQKFNVVFAGVQNEATRHVQELVKNFGQSELAATRMMAQVGDLMRGTGMKQEDIVAISGQLSKLGADLTSFANYAGGAEQATFDLAKAALGETEAAKTLGVFIKTDTKEFKNLEKQAKNTGVFIAGMGKTFKGSTEVQARAFAALAQMMEQKGYVLGDFLRSMGSIANTGRTVENSLTSLKTAFGGFIDSFMRVGDIQSNTSKILDNITATIKKNSSEWSYWISWFLNVWKSGFKIIWTVSKNAFTNVAVFGKYVWEIIVQAWSDAPGFFGAVWEDMKQHINNVFEFIRMIFVNGAKSWGEVFGAVSKLFLNNLNNLKENFFNIFKNISEIVLHYMNSIVIYFEEAIKGIGRLLGEFGKNFWDLMTGKKSFSDVFQDMFAKSLAEFKNLKDKVEKEWEGFSFGEGIKNQGKYLNEFANDLAKIYKKNLKMNADSAVEIFSTTGKNTAEYLAKNGIKLGEFISPFKGLKQIFDDFVEEDKRIKARRGMAAQSTSTNSNANNILQNTYKTVAGSIRNIVNGFKATAENVIGANTLEGVRLQSRILGSGSENINNKLYENSRKQTQILSQIGNNTSKISLSIPRNFAAVGNFIRPMPKNQNLIPDTLYLFTDEYKKEIQKKVKENLEKLKKPLISVPFANFLPKPEKFNGWQKILDFMNTTPKGEKMVFKFDENGNFINGKNGKALDFSKIPDQKLMDIFYKNFISSDLYKMIPTKANLEKLFDSGPLWEKFLNEEPKQEKQVLRLGEDGIIAGIKTNKISDIPKDLKNMVAFLKEMRDDIHNIRRNGNTMNIRAV